MKQPRISSSLCASAAIAAALSLSATPSFAQEAAASVIDSPVSAQAPAATIDAAPITAPPPQIVLTPEPAAPAASGPQTETTAAPPARRVAAPARTRVRTAAPVATAATPLAKDAAPASAEPVIAPIAAVPAAPAIVAEPQAIETPTPLAADDSGGDALAIAAILAGLAGIGAAGAMAARRRRRLITADEPAYEPVAATVPVDIRPAATSPATVREYAIAGTAGERATGWAVAQGNVAMPFAVPEGPVPSGTAREHLIERMVAARPDAANPFKSTVARRKRARIILQARAHRQRQAATAPFDFRTYKDIEAEGAELAATPHIAGA